ncbi:hypothetical protein CLV30_102132 [Haloactinopolyspora alba]|uniref:Uncharacterized protein n=1 Tax=Haloactinopolyspora alba TaxID=648780 RepID=A0A2P8EBA5_9ACTN|nr:hypothetical protein [Haloactinopolyspora alba]PSL06746.1 hypothetical protein CLV30_102132 [Haloactinopolyspora alba]
MMASTPDLDTVAAREAALVEVGYQRFDTGMPNRLFYRRGADGRRTHHLHVVTKTGLIQELVDAARAERGLASVPVWEE